MIGEDLERIRDSLDRLGEIMWARAEKVSEQPVIHPTDIRQLVRPAVGEIHGLAAAIGWHVEQKEEE